MIGTCPQEDLLGKYDAVAGDKDKTINAIGRVEQ
jgi:hypothetical protein